MPFTPSHVVAVLPLVRARRWLRLDPTSLVIGSMAPDFEYFAHGRLGGEVGHTVLGLVIWCLPVTVVLAALYHARVKWMWLVVAPAAVTARALTAMAGRWRPRWDAGAVLACAAGAIVGGATHLVWDGVTHAQGFTAKRIHALYTVVDVPVLGPLPMFRVLQHASSVAGLVILAGLLARAWPRQPRVDLPPVPRAGARALLAATCALGVAALGLRVGLSRHWETADLIVATISGVLGGSLLTSLAVRGRALRTIIAA